MTVGEICNHHVVMASPGEMLVDTAKRMRTSHVGCVIVVESREGRHVPVGIVTDRDIVVSALAGDPEHVTFLLVRDVMTTNLVTASVVESVETALMRMSEHGVRRLPVVDATGTLTGIVTADDIWRHLAGLQATLVELVAREQAQEQHHRL